MQLSMQMIVRTFIIVYIVLKQGGNRVILNQKRREEAIYKFLF